MTLGLQPLLLVTLGDGNMTSALDLFATGLQLGQVDHLRLVGVDQPSLLLVEPLQLDLPSLDRGTAVVPRLRLPRQLFEACGQRAGDLEQRLDVPPEGRVELLDLGQRLLELGAELLAVGLGGVGALAQLVRARGLAAQLLHLEGELVGLGQLGGEVVDT